ncbi:MAG: cob(I)yrinic acid a,c-diamide adenosyltransferase [Clostridia bacterium]|nr:cob(I)yrinic acid a,c-diamide adenosyltransferase [Clostridia bacterium]
MSKLYTKTGDTGRASTLTRQNIPKNSPIFELLGTLDELTSCLGMARAKVPGMAELLEQIQADLLGVSGELSGGKRYAEPDRVAQLERAIDSVCEGNASFEGFVLPGKTEGGAALDVARTVARRAERCAVAASQTGGITRDMLAWLNRLSDLLYALARLCDRTNSSVAKQPARTNAGAVGEGFCDKAMALCREVQRYAATQGVKVVTAVCDAGGNPVAMLRADDAFIASVDIAVNKAFTSVSLKMTTEELGKLAQPGESLYGIQFTNNNRIVIFGGGVPLTEDGVIVGGFGVSGGTAAEDTTFGNYAKEFYEKELR